MSSVVVSSVVVAPAERYVVDVSFPEAGHAAMANTLQAVNHFRGEFYPHIDTLATVRASGPPIQDAIAEAFETLREYAEVAAETEPLRAHLGPVGGGASCSMVSW